MKCAILALAALQIASAQGGPALEGTWIGSLRTQPGQMRLGLHVTRAADGSLQATLDSIDQGANNIPVSSIRQTGSTVSLAIQAVGASYEGTLAAGGAEMVGEWKQAGATLPLTFARTDKLPVSRRPQEPKKPYPYTEEEVVYDNKEGGSRLTGALTTPPGAGPFPAVLLITGSGQQDRDESLLGHRPFLVLADHLTRKGIAVLRVDDRGMGGSTGEVKTATTEDFAGDVKAGVEFLKTRAPKIDPRRIGLIGHSEGGLIAPMVAARSRDIAFIVLMAGTGVTGEEVINGQAAAIARLGGASEAVIAGNRAIQEQVNAIVKAETDPKARDTRLRELRDKLVAEMKGVGQVLDVQFKRAASPWFRYFLMYDPVTALRSVSCPVLALNGELDLQVLPAQNLPAIAKALEEGGNPDYTLVKLPKLNHLFQTSNTGSPSEYGKIEETLAPVALETISGWILKHTR
ncbi:MAG TPA: alpha/beta fold hydrolase [Bryobacteraceae bacterium]|nr:alpha/beta fold hydrolase [Bryobacteraceae bacterium]